MRRGRAGRAAVDGAVHALLLVGTNELLSSSWTAAWAVEACFIPPLLAGIVSAGTLAGLIRRERRIGRMCLMSSLF